MVKFSILIPTFNRHDIVFFAIESILNQTYQNFEILLLDNGSKPPLDSSNFLDPRIRFFQNEYNIEPAESGELILDKINGTHFLFLADDDALVPNALEIVKTIFETNPGMESLSTGVFHYNHIYNIIVENSNYFEKFSGKLESYDSWEAMLYYFNGYWGIGEKKRYKGPRASHSSGSFFTKNLIEKTRNTQKELYIKTFGDVGYIGTLLHVNKTYYLDLPLAIIGQTIISDSAGMQLGSRIKIDPRYQKNLEYTPLKGVSFINIGTDTHLRVIHRNKLENLIDCSLRPQFYFKHLEAIITDFPWTKQTNRDFKETIPYLMNSLKNIKSIKGIINTFLSAFSFFFTLFWSISRKVKILFSCNNKNELELNERKYSSEKTRFLDINDAGKWVDDNYILPLWIKTELK